ncbi:MAG TPA: double-cubane-cluster-containing anaerobic reductase [Verrucomicrobiae bacterium]
MDSQRNENRDSGAEIAANAPLASKANAALGAEAGCQTGNATSSSSPLAHFDRMLDRCYEFAEAAKAEGRPIVGIMCEFTPRELILAAGGVPVCLCGGSAETIAPAEQYLPANLCPLIKSTFGYFVTTKNPFLNWADLVVAETTCDGKKKMFELLGQSKPMYVLELPQKAGDADALERWVAEVHKFKAHLEARFEVKITAAKLHEAIQLMNRERRLRRQLASLMAQENPPLTGRQLLGCKSTISGIEADLCQYERVYEWCVANGAQAQSSKSQVEDPQHAGHGSEHPGRSAKPKVRVLLTGVPLVHGAERVLEIIEGCGAVVVCMENCTGIKPILEDVDLGAPDPVRAIAEKYYHLPCSVMTVNRRRFESLRKLAAQFRPQCVIELVWQACLTYDVESFQVRRLVEEDLRLPYLKVTTDYSEADSARIRARVEALLEMVRG